MVLFKTKYIYLTSLVAVIAVILSFTIPSLFENQHTQASEGNGNAWNVSSLEEASNIAGFNVSVPKTIPALMEKSTNISVIQLETKNETKVVKQEWQSSDDSRFYLIQTPELNFPENGEGFSIGQLAGEKVYIDAMPEGNRSALVTYYWIFGDMTYSLCGTITESMSEEDLVSIIESIEY